MRAAEGPASGFHDPRMRGFRTRTAVDEVIALIDARIATLDAEWAGQGGMAGRVLNSDMASDVSLPAFDRAAMDGYAVRGEETLGADAYSPAEFRRVGEARPGRAFDGRLRPGEAVEIATGSPMPAGADTVVPVEATTTTGDLVRVTEPVPAGRHVGRAGEDVAAGTTLLKRGRVLRPQDVGLLSGLGVNRVPVVRQPRVTILSTGDELLPAFTAADGPRFADMNAPMLEALVTRDGGRASAVGPLADRRELIREVLTQVVTESDAVLISGGSSTGPEDHAPGLVAELGELVVHGVAVRPASPAGLGFVGRVPVLLLPSNPVSCLCAYDLFGGRIVRRLGGRSSEWPYRSESRRLASKLVSVVGRTDYVRVACDGEGNVEPLAVGGASILSSASRADGFVLVAPDLEGYPAGAVVTVWRYDA